MEVSAAALGIGIGVTVWLVLLSVFVFRMTSHYNRLTRGVSKQGLKEILEAILDIQKGLKKQADHLTVEVERSIAQGQFHIQQVGIVRFNPFADTGGAQSFSLALLDGHENGIVITSLYARTGNRWYVKAITKGQGENVALSREERTAIEQAHNMHI